ncbi:MAG: type 4a pilus biogenesis protein PilO [Planctomycetes bacterium]|nr:type 4a pilus biogenesis protein PilO [Planctomycetota bacterium]
MKLDKQQLIILGLSAVILCGFGIFQYIPVIRQKHAIRDRMAQQDQISETICSQSALLPELKQQEKQLQEELVPFSKKVPQGRRFATLWQQVADVMNECKLTDQLVQPGEELKSDSLCSIPLTFECQGSLKQLFAFFQAMENMDRLIRFEEVKFENDSDFNAVVKLNAKANVYYQPDSRDNS